MRSTRVQVAVETTTERITIEVQSKYTLNNEHQHEQRMMPDDAEADWYDFDMIMNKKWRFRLHNMPKVMFTAVAVTGA